MTESQGRGGGGCRPSTGGSLFPPPSGGVKISLVGMYIVQSDMKLNRNVVGRWIVHLGLR